MRKSAQPCLNQKRASGASSWFWSAGSNKTLAGSCHRTVLCPLKVELRSCPGDLCVAFLHVVIVATDFFSHSRMLRTSAPGWFKQRRPIAAKTETAPNSSTGSGRLVFPRADGDVPSFPSKGIWIRRVPETSPCHGQAKQIGELDPRKVTRDGRERSRGIETSTELVVGSRSVSAQFVNGSARGQPRLDPVKENLRSPTRRPIQA